MTNGSRNDRLSPAWIVLTFALALSVACSFTDRIRILFEPGYFLPILVAYLASRSGTRIFNILLILGLVTAFDISFRMDAVRFSFDNPNGAYLIGVLAAVAFAKPDPNQFPTEWFHPWWRWALWAVLFVLALGGFLRLGWRYEIAQGLRSTWSVGAIAATLVALASLNWTRIVMHFRLPDSALNQRPVRTVLVIISLCILVAALVVRVRFPNLGILHVGFGLANTWSWLTVACFAVAAFGLLDWRVLVTMLILLFTAEWVCTQIWTLTPVKFSITSGKEAGEIATAWDYTAKPRLSLLASSVSAVLFGSVIRPFWLRRKIGALEERPTLCLLATILSIQFIILPFLSKGQTVSSDVMLLGGLMFTAGLIWRRKAMVAAPLAIMLCYLIGLVVYDERGLYYLSVRMGDFGMLAFPFVFFGVLVGEHVRRPRTAEGVLRTVDLTPLSKLIRDLDVSATLKAFFAVLAPLIVIGNLGAIYSPIAMILDFDFDSLLAAALMIISILAAFAPLGFIVTDWIPRREAGRYLSAITGAGLGLLGILAVSQALGASTFLVQEAEWAPYEAGRWILSGAVALVLALIVGRMVARSIRLRRVMLGALLFPFIIFIVVVAFQNIAELQGPEDSDDLWTVLLVIAATAILIWFIVRGVRIRLLLSGTRPRSMLFGELRGGFWVRMAFLVGLPSSMWRLTAMRRPSFWLFIVSRPLVYVGAALLAANLERLGFVVALGLGIVVIAAGHLAFVAAKRLAARDVWRPEQVGEISPPILFLRSFDDDQFDFKRPIWDLRGRWFDLWSLRSNADQALIDEVAQYGPVVALGRPGETKAPFGALRHYATNEEWQTVITDTARRAQAIIIAAGDSEGVLWEYDLLKREGLIDRTLLLFRPGSGEAAVNRRALEAFCSALNVSYEFEADHHMVALLQTDSGPVLLTTRRNLASAYVTAIRAHFQRCSIRALSDPSDLFAVMV